MLWAVCLGSILLLGGGDAVAQGLLAVYVPEASEHLIEPEAEFWARAAEATVTMLPQNVTTPKHERVAVGSLKVRAVHNGHSFAFRIEWDDPTPSDRIVTDEFGDQVAIELPVKSDKVAPLPSPMMGNPGGRVAIFQWRAAFQRDLEQGESDVRDLYPYAHVDVYPDQVLRVTDARPYLGAVGLDNPISRPLHTPVLDQMAEGWGTMTVKPEQHAAGKGVWRDGRWRVAIVHPLAAGGESDPHLEPGAQTSVAFAVWEGAAREVGARKAWSNWVPVRFE